MALRKRKEDGFGQDEFPGKEVKRRKQNPPKGRGPRPSAQSDPLERRRHRWRKQTEREQELGLAAGRGISALDDDELGEDGDMAAEPMVFENPDQLDEDEDWEDEDLDGCDFDSDQDEWQ